MIGIKLGFICNVGWCKVDSHKELLGCRIPELLRVYDVQVVLGEETGDGMDDAGSIGT